MSVVAVPPASPDEASLPEYLTVAEFQRAMRVGRSTAYNIIRSGAVPHRRYGKVIRIHRSALQAPVHDDAHREPVGA